MPTLLPNPKFQFENSAGLPYAGGSLTFYLTTTSTPQATYPTPADATAGTNANSNPVTLNSAGWPAVDIYLSPSVKYKVVLKDSSANEIWTVDPVSTTDFSVVPLWSTVAGSPTGTVAGTAASSGVLPSMVWDRTNNVMYVCVTTGAAATAVWTAINPAGSQLVWTIADRVSAAPAAAAEGTSYIVSSSFGSFVTGDIITDDGTGAFTVTQPGTDVGWIAYVQDEDAYYSFTGSAWAIGLGSVALQVFTASGTYTPATGMAQCLVISTGGGGGGGGADSDGTARVATGGGGAGATAIELFSAATIGASQTVTIGAAGAAGANTGTSGGNGGDTTFGALHTAGGGLGGTGLAGADNDNTVDGGAGGTATGGTLNISGGDGANGITIANLLLAGIGGASFWGGGGRGGSAIGSTATDAGTAGVAYGSGGGGSTNLNDTGGIAGLAGAGGVVIVLEFGA